MWLESMIDAMQLVASAKNDAQRRRDVRGDTRQRVYLDQLEVFRLAHSFSVSLKRIRQSTISGTAWPLTRRNRASK